MMKQLSITEIKQHLEHDCLTKQEIEKLYEDERKGVQQLLRAYERKQQRLRLQEEQFLQLKQFDERYKMEKETLIAGVDEAGRGPLAGPVVSAAVILPSNFECIGINDSKQLNEKNRNTFYERIRDQAIAYHIAIVNHDEIDRLNILEATRKSMLEALLQLSPKPDIALVDAVSLRAPNIEIVPINKGDALSLSIAAASILAKVTRDALMDELDAQYPAYGFKQNKGYGSKQHLEALRRLGPTPYHRRSFAPVRQSVNE